MTEVIHGSVSGQIWSAIFVPYLIAIAAVIAATMPARARVRSTSAATTRGLGLSPILPVVGPAVLAGSGPARLAQPNDPSPIPCYQRPGTMVTSVPGRRGRCHDAWCRVPVPARLSLAPSDGLPRTGENDRAPGGVVRGPSLGQHNPSGGVSRGHSVASFDGRCPDDPRTESDVHGTPGAKVKAARDGRGCETIRRARHRINVFPSPALTNHEVLAWHSR
jgi:hypothetical protein